MDGSGTANLLEKLRAYFSEIATNCKEIKTSNIQGANV